MHKNLIITRIYVYNVSKQNPFPKKYDEKGNSSLMDRASHESCARFDGSKAGRGWRAVFPERLYPARVVVADHERREERSSDRESWRITARNRRSVPFLFFFSSSSLHRASLCAALPLLSAHDSTEPSSIETQQVELGWFSKKLAEFIKPAHDFHRASESLSSNLDRAHFLLLRKEKISPDLARSWVKFTETFARSKKGFKFVVFGEGKKKTTIISDLYLD